ncbi:hypothetical protein [Chondrinema litorale]|uniref:hypothetical protein n=1 Tax=Chondrinema litorale TaxID=2994555 RepID=UPI002542DA07|nr:hypothetical protein [Chondrinema litorale]UZR93482.1 hypothetical protein OQ292_16635 [Chondrinema litorale]
MKTMTHELDKILDSIPINVTFNEIVELDKLNDRISAISVLYANTIGVCEGYLEYCPDSILPSLEENLSWIWTIRPDLGDDMMVMDIPESFKVLITAYKGNNMDQFWDFMSKN